MKEPQNPFLVLIEEHNAAIESVCRSFCGSIREDREDLRQEIVINLWTGWQRQHPFGSGSAWLWRVAVNTAISFRRRQKRQIETVAPQGVEYPEDSTDREAVETLNALMQRLPARDQRLLRLYIDGWRHKEIAAMLGTTESNIQTRMGRIKAKLKVLYSEEH